MANTDNDRKLTVEEALDCASSRARRRFDIRVVGHQRFTQCPESDHDTSYKILLYDDGFYCNRCGEGGSVPALFRHLLQKSESIRDNKEAAKIMHSMIRGEDPKARAAKPQVTVVSKAPDVTFDVADISIRDKTYRALLDQLILSSTDREDLRNRGLSNEDIRELGYKTAPRNPKDVCKKLLNEGHILEGVPGFYKDEDGAWTIRYLGEGYYIPFRNAFGQIQFMQIRTRKKKENGTRYFSLSSRTYEHGTGAKSWAHIHKGKDPEWWKRIVITEGALKADIASIKSGETFVAVAGVKNLGDLPRALRDLAFLGLEHVTIAYDSEDNKATEEGKRIIEKMLSVEFLEIPNIECEWSKETKGIDDWLQAKETRTSGEA